ncbi:HNH endonuclease signature motif containing protein [Flavobacterium chryseum]|uniref:HNH endonuclease signature motif containing protein n=1 Tax=Flavobacterium sp. P3160 TaxID=2512113 RepID=UPI0029392C63|nr:HNH endonuclease signature motif containing protein [Flavobacterium sp. P3160]
MTVESVPRISTWESIGNFFGELWETVAGGSDVKTDLIPKNAMEQSIDKSKSNANEKTKLEDIPKPGKGKGSVAKADRDPKRTLTKKEKAEAIEERGGTCEGCNKEVTTETADAHHTERHADGGKTTKENTNILCKDCHKTIHK